MFKIRNAIEISLINLNGIYIINLTVRKSSFLNMRLRKVKDNIDCFMVRDTSINIK